MEQQTEYPKLYSPLATVVITIFIFFVSQVLGGLLIGFYLGAQHHDVAGINDALESNVWLQFGFVALVETLTLYLIWLFLKHRKLSFKDIGFNTPKPTFVGYALIGFVTYFVLYIATLIIAKQLIPSLNLDQKQELGVNMATQGKDLLPVFISLVILPPIAEEIVARGFLFGGLRTKLQFIPAAIITSIMFGAAHLSEASDGLLWVAAIDTFVLSMVLCYLREKTGSLWSSIGVHMMKNGLAFIFLFNLIR